ncbi:hypothetical protein ACFPRL_26505 [Pseudoclavibacter helvolus]
MIRECRRRGHGASLFAAPPLSPTRVERRLASRGGRRLRVWRTHQRAPRRCPWLRSSRAATACARLRGRRGRCDRGCGGAGEPAARSGRRLSALGPAPRAPVRDDAPDDEREDKEERDGEADVRDEQQRRPDRVGCVDLDAEERRREQHEERDEGDRRDAEGHESEDAFALRDGGAVGRGHRTRLIDMRATVDWFGSAARRG